MEVSIPTIPVFVMYAALYKAGPLQFKISCHGPDGDKSALEFWLASLTQPWGANHPGLRSETGEMKDLSKV